jgi:hypothetical protein
MGLRNNRAICPNCGGKLHTQAKGLGHISLWMNSGPLVQTGNQCQWCGIALSGKVGLGNRAITVEEDDELQAQRQRAIDAAEGKAYGTKGPVPWA